MGDLPSFPRISCVSQFDNSRQLVLPKGVSETLFPGCARWVTRAGRPRREVFDGTLAITGLSRSSFSLNDILLAVLACRRRAALVMIGDCPSGGRLIGCLCFFDTGPMSAPFSGAKDDNDDIVDDGSSIRKASNFARIPSSADRGAWLCRATTLVLCCDDRDWGFDGLRFVAVTAVPMEPGIAFKDRLRPDSADWRSGIRFSMEARMYDGPDTLEKASLSTARTFAFDNFSPVGVTNLGLPVEASTRSSTGRSSSAVQQGSASWCV